MKTRRDLLEAHCVSSCSAVFQKIVMREPVAKKGHYVDRKRTKTRQNDKKEKGEQSIDLGLERAACCLSSCSTADYSARPHMKGRSSSQDISLLVISVGRRTASNHYPVENMT